MSANPYQSPVAESLSPDHQLPGRRESLAALHKACLLLLAAGLVNYYAFDMRDIAGAGYDARLKTVVRTMNLVGIAVVFLLSWFFSLPLLQLVARAIRALAGRHVSPDRWNDALYESLKPAAHLSEAGAILWVLWVVAIYYAQLNFVVISFAVGLPAHLLAACVYVPLSVRWFRLARGQGSRPSFMEDE
jgi:hypothetical protein